MKRTPEPELMDGAEQARVYAQADFTEANSLFVDTFDGAFREFDGTLIYDLGCGPADIPVRLARRYPQAQIIAIDGAPRMLEHAAASIASAGLADKIHLRRLRLDSSGPPPPLCGQADAVVSNSLLHHLADPLVLWHWVAACRRPGAAVLVMDLLRPVDEHQARRLVEHYSADEPVLLQRDFYASLLAAYRPDEVAEQLAGAGLDDCTVTRISDRHLCVRSVP